VSRKNAGQAVELFLVSGTGFPVKMKKWVSVKWSRIPAAAKMTLIITGNYFNL
jgi:hypothetical protein